MKTYDMYGAEFGSIEKIRNAIEEALVVKLTPRKSAYLGEYYLGNLNEEEFQLRRNLDPLDGESVEKNLSKDGVLFYINRTERAKELEKLLRAKVPELHLLKRGELQ